MKRTIKIGLIGFGSIGDRHFHNVRKYSSDIVVLTKRKDVPASVVVHNWHQFAQYAPFDVIFITNETFKHIPTLKKCLKLRPRAIFLEKPLSHNLKDLLEVERRIRKYRISLYVGYNFHFFKPFLRIKNIIESGKLGKIYYLKALVGQDLKSWRTRNYRKNYAVSRKLGGGVVLDLVHDINYPAWLLSDRLVYKTSVLTKVSNLRIDTEDTAESIFVTERKGVVVTVHQDYTRVPRKQSLEIAGENGSLEWDSIGNEIVVRTGNTVTRESVLSERKEMFEDEIAHFFRNMEGTHFFTNIGEAMYDMKLISYIKKYAKK